MADNHINKRDFKVPYVCGCRDLGEALRRIAEGAAMMRTKGEAGTGNVVEAVRHIRTVNKQKFRHCFFRRGWPREQGAHECPRLQFRPAWARFLFLRTSAPAAWNREIWRRARTRGLIFPRARSSLKSLRLAVAADFRPPCSWFGARPGSPPSGGRGI